MKRLAIIIPISTFRIFVLLFDAFKSIKNALLILVNAPLGLISGLVSATLLTLMVFPTLYLVIKRRGNELAAPAAS